MYRDPRNTSQRGVDPQCQVVVKLKRTREFRGPMRAVAHDGAAPPTSGAGGTLNKLLASKKTLDFSPIFGEAPRRGVAAFRRMAVAAESEKENELSGLNVLSLGSRSDAKRACDQVGRDPLVEYAYVIPEKYLLATRRRANSQDPMRNRQWGLSAIDVFQAEQSANYRSTRTVKVAVIDSGVDDSHPDLQGVLTEVQSFTSGPLRDTSGHGTHVSGIIGAVRNNDRGIRGVCDTHRIMSLKALDPYSGPGYYRALRHATDGGAQVINLSLGGGYDPTEEKLVKRAIRRGVVVVAAMGNEKLEGNPTSWPARIVRVIAVGATDETDRIASFSNTGRHIDMVAPGVNVLSTVPTYPSSLAHGTDYEAWPGTSMATPHVAAAAAMLLARRPGARPAQIRRALVRGADAVPGQRGFNATYGHGRLNVRRSLTLI